MTDALPRVLCVDDEPNVLAGLVRALRRRFEVIAATGPIAGLQALEENGPFAAVISDLRMPEMDGISFLERCRSSAPDTVRLLLSGHADLESALDAVNRGAIFRFLLKPSSGDSLITALSAAAAQYRLVTAEKVLLEQTLHGSIRALTDVLALVNPAGFGRSARAKAIAGEVGRVMDHPAIWEVEIAAMISQLGTVTLPQNTVEKLYAGRPLTYSETLCVERLPKIASEIVGTIPRLDGVREILLQQDLKYVPVVLGQKAPFGEAICLGARILRAVLDLDLLETQGISRPVALDTLRGREGVYDPAALDALEHVCGVGEEKQRVLEIELRAVRAGMIFAEDIRTTTDILLVARGQQVTDQLAERIRNFLHLVETKRPVRVIIPEAAASIPACVPQPA